MLCADCQADMDKWLDHRESLHYGVQISQIGTGNHNVSSWTRTHEVVRAQVRLIREGCRAHHTENCQVGDTTVDSGHEVAFTDLSKEN